MSYNPKVVSFERSPAYMHHRAMINRRENNSVDALELMRHAVSKEPENVEYKLDLAEMYCEMGCHEQSSRLLLDMLAKNDAPPECYYGLALNQLGVNDLAGAKRSLRTYRKTEPNGPHAPEAKRLVTELDIYETLNRPANRKTLRAMHLADMACDALREEDFPRAKRMFERSFALSPEQYEMRALYAMTLALSGDMESALQNARQAAKCFPPSVRAMCVAAQVLHMADEQAEAEALLEKALKEQSDGIELRLLIYTLSEMGMHQKIVDCSRLALQETPFDRRMLHVRAAALYYSGAPEEQSERFWMRILRIDPDDSIALFYQSVAARGELKQNEPDYDYQVPTAEFERRVQYLTQITSGGMSAVNKAWSEDVVFRRYIRWAALTDDSRLRRIAITVLSITDDEEAQSDLRLLLFNREIQPELRMHMVELLKLSGIDIAKILPSEYDEQDALLVESDQIIARLPVGERQLIRFANEELETAYGISALSSLLLIWSIYRMNRDFTFDPMIHTEAAAGALVFVLLMTRNQNPSYAEIAERFHCSVRRLVFYTSRIAGAMDKFEGDSKDEHS